jgi:starch phosphorylase
MDQAVKRKRPALEARNPLPGGAYERHLRLDKVMDASDATPRDKFEALARAVRDRLADRWITTRQTYARENPKCTYYLSMEFLLGRALSNNLMNLMDRDNRHAATLELADCVRVIEEEPDPGLGNGGLGRLAACFLDSMATLELPAMGYGLRYEYGMFRQSIHDGWQEEQPDNWLRLPDPWEVARPDERVAVEFGSSFALRNGEITLIPNRPSTLIGIPFDRPVVGHGVDTINTLRLWSAVAPDYFDFKRFSAGRFVGALVEELAAESLTRVLYPDDSTTRGKGLRLLQEYFLVACSLADLVRRFRVANSDWRLLPSKAAIQLNDTHPALAIPELMRILLNEAGLSWDEAWDITQRTLAYTNHTLLPEALEKWPVAWFELLLPRHLEIIYEINRRFLSSVRARAPGDAELVRRASLIEEGATKHVRMANLAIVGSHSTNGVSQIHTRLLQTTTVRDLADLLPDRFNNKTNGVSPRRWLRLANPALAATVTDAIGRGWIADLAELHRLRPFADDGAFRSQFRQAKRHAKLRLTEWLERTCGLAIDPETVFDCQVKRIHEYKRQLLNALRIVTLYIRLRENRSTDTVPRTFFFAGKAAPSYRLAKVIIKFINNLAGTIDCDPLVAGRLRVVFLPEYDVSLAERLIPAADISNQISTAGYEASGTSNMKFMMNGALTLGTRDGATIEMAREAGEENLFLFGLTAQQVVDSRGWYSPCWHYDNEAETRAALDLILSGHFCRHEPEIGELLRQELLSSGDYYMHLADLRSYLQADARLDELYRDPEAWSRKAILNVAGSGIFSSDRAVAEYARDIWDAKPCRVGPSEAYA